MIFVYWILLAGAVFILGAMIWLLLYEPAPAPPEKKEDLQIAESANPDADALWQSAVLKWPELSVGFERHALKHGFLIKWAGLAKEGDVYLFDTVHENVFSLIMRASERMIRDHVIPSHGYWVMVPLSESCHAECAMEASRLLRSMNTEIALVIEEYPSFDHFFNDERTAALICTGTKSGMEIISDDIGWEFAVHDNEYARSAYEAITDELPLRLKMQMRFFRRKGINSLMRLVPKTREWYRTAIVRDGGRYILSSPLPAIPQKDIDALRTSTGELRIIRESHASVYLLTGSETYRRMEKLILSMFDAKPCIPVLRTGTELWKGMHVIGFAPVFSKNDPIKDAAVRFYQELLR